MAHNGVLFLDELPEFQRRVLESLRQPMEDGVVCIARAASRISFPARAMLVAAMNPCPCGWAGHDRRPCICSEDAIHRYRSRVSGPLLDRIDVHVEVPPTQYEHLSGPASGASSAHMCDQVQEARARSCRRGSVAAPSGYEMASGAQKLLRHCVDAAGMSARGYTRMLRVARTIADLDGSAPVSEAHVAEALAYRGADGAGERV